MVDAQFKLEEAQKGYDKAVWDLQEVKDLKEAYDKEVQKVQDNARLT
jgi:hypothetical protein